MFVRAALPHLRVRDANARLGLGRLILPWVLAINVPVASVGPKFTIGLPSQHALLVYVQPRRTNTTSRIGIGTPRSQRKAQPTAPLGDGALVGSEGDGVLSGLVMPLGCTSHTALHCHLKDAPLLDTWAIERSAFAPPSPAHDAAHRLSKSKSLIATPGSRWSCARASSRA